MKNNCLILSLLLIVTLSCESYRPFASRKAKKDNIELIKNSLNLSSAEFKKLEGNDSILYSIAQSAKHKRLKKQKIKKRLDSFFYGKYDIKQLSIILELDRNFPDSEIDFEKDGSRERIEFKSLAELKKFVKKIDSTFSQEIIIVIDSTKQKKQ